MVHKRGRSAPARSPSEELQELKSKFEQAKKQLKDAKLEHKYLQRDLRICDTKMEQDAENASKKTESQHEKDKRIAVDNAIQQTSLEAELNAAEKAAEKEQEYKQRTRFAVEDAMKNAAVEAAKKEQQYELAMRGETYLRLLPPWNGRRRRWAT